MIPSSAYLRSAKCPIPDSYLSAKSHNQMFSRIGTVGLTREFSVQLANSTNRCEEGGRLIAYDVID